MMNHVAKPRRLFGPGWGENVLPPSFAFPPPPFCAIFSAHCFPFVLRRRPAV
jgi:hypothetical protein